MGRKNLEECEEEYEADSKEKSLAGIQDTAVLHCSRAIFLTVEAFGFPTFWG